MKEPQPTVLPNWKAIAAMAGNRVIGRGLTIPWHLPEDFRWFKETTMGATLLMGRRTFESIGRPLPGRRTVVLSRGHFGAPSGVAVVSSAEELEGLPGDGAVFVCGGAQVYRALLPRCAELLLTRLRMDVEGDVLFPPFEHLFQMDSVLRETGEFTIERWRRLPAGPIRVGLQQADELPPTATGAGR